jgi:hypothetical protein
LPVYTSYEMIADCQAGKAKGWVHFVTQYVPVMRLLLAHYYPHLEDRDAVIQRLIENWRAPGATLWQRQPESERPFLAALRTEVLEQLRQHERPQETEIDLPLETLSAATTEFSPLECQVLWLETMRYDAASTAEMLAMAAATVTSIRERAAELLRRNMESWSSQLLFNNGFVLGRAARALGNQASIESKQALDVIDGRASWGERAAVELAVKDSWQAVDLVCRMREAHALVRASKPLSDTEAAAWRSKLGLGGPGKKGLLGKLFASR